MKRPWVKNQSNGVGMTWRVTEVHSDARLRIPLRGIAGLSFGLHYKNRASEGVLKLKHHICIDSCESLHG